jgi:hypothetical protein
MDPLIVNLFAGPGAGKSTTAAGVFAELKMRNHRVELVTEVAKDFTYAESWKELNDPLLVFALQRHRLRRVADSVEIAITDSPILLPLVYGAEGVEGLPRVIHEAFKAQRNFNVVLARVKPYQEYGRTQTKREAIKKDDQIRTLLATNLIPIDMRLDGDRNAMFKIADAVEQRIRNG